MATSGAAISSPVPQEPQRSSVVPGAYAVCAPQVGHVEVSGAGPGVAGWLSIVTLGSLRPAAPAAGCPAL